MRIPPFFSQPSWQRFLAGVVIGALISWVLFFYMFGIQQDKQILTIQTQKEQIDDLNEKIAILGRRLSKIKYPN